MASQPVILMIDPTHYDVSYAINPWMDPSKWAQDATGFHARAQQASAQLKQALEKAGCKVEMYPGQAGLPDMVFPANAGIVLDGRVLVARFRYPQRQGEEAHFKNIFKDLQHRGLLQEIGELPPNCFQEGAGDCIWDKNRQHFWVGYGPRSSANSVAAITDFFQKKVVALELASDRCYHLDVCFCPLANGEILYFPPALTEQARKTLYEHVKADKLIEASEDDLCHFNVNAVNIGNHIVMSKVTDCLRDKLEARGYKVHEVDLQPYMMSGGASYCMTLRLDRSSQ